MKKSLLFLAALLVAACGRDVPPTGSSAPGPSWLFLDKGPYTLTSHVDLTGVAGLVLVTDRSLMAETPDTVLTRTVTIGEDSLLTVALGKLEPGFYEVRLNDSLRFNIGVQPDKVVSKPDPQPDFDAFWDTTLRELAEIPAEAQWELVPEYSNELRQCFRISFESLDGGIGGGIISIPVAEGKYPVFIQYMGYGAEPFYFDPSANPDRIDFLVSVRGQGIFKEARTDWIDRGLQDKADYYYRGAFCDAVRAAEIAAALDKADPEKMVALGESQGGALTAVAAALWGKFKVISIAVPFLGDYRDYARIVWWPVHEVMEAADKAGIDYDTLFTLLSYFDVKNLAPRITCPVVMAFGLQDPTCPPHTNFAIYNNLGTSDKSFWCVPTCGHAMWLEDSWPPVRDAFIAERL